jgi:putative hydrolase of the HAD superfamily
MDDKAKSIADPVSFGEIDVLVFDFDGTLYESSAGIEQQLRPLMVRHAAQVLGVSAKETRRVLAGYRAEYKSSVLGLREHHGVDPETFLRNMYDDLDLAKMTARPGLRFELERLRKKVPLIVFTNSNRSFTHRAIGLLGLAGVFEIVFTVENNGFIRKPEIEAYEGLYRSLNLVPRRVAMFDDIASSLRIMSGFGSRTILVGNGLRVEPNFVDLHTGEEHSQVPDFVDAATHDLVGFLKAMNEELEK